MAHLNSRWARDGLTAEQAGHVVLSRGSLAEITGRVQREPAVNALRTLAGFVSLSIDDDGAFISVHWPKFAEFQGYASRSGEAPGQLSARELPPPQTPPQTHTQEEEKKTRAPRSPPSCPEWALTLSDLLIEKVREVPGGRIPRGARPSWAREIAKLPGEVPSLAANGDDPAMHIEAGIRWALGPENVGRDFEVVVRSGKALREKWPKLVAAARRQRAKTAPREGMEAWVKSYET
jgi:hypothetical protein